MITASWPVKQLLASFIVSIASFSTGIMMGWPNAVIPQVLDGSAGFTLIEDEIALLVSISCVGGIISAIATGYLADSIGRKTSLICFNAINALLWGSHLLTKNVYVLYAIHFFFGFWINFAYSVVPIYISETVDAHIRGGVGAFNEFMIFFGMLLTGLTTRLPYQMMTLACTAPSVLLVFGLFLIPESPYYNLLKFDSQQALKNLEWLRGGSQQTELEKRQQAVNKEMCINKGFFDIFLFRPNLKAFLMVQFLMVFSGNSSYYFLSIYATLIFPDFWITPQISFMVLCGVWVVSSAIFCSLIEKCGRKTWIYISCAGTFLALSCTSVWYYLRDKTSVDTSTTEWVPLVTLMIAGFFEVGGGFAVPSVIKGEIFPINIRSMAVALSSITLCFVNGINLYFYFDIVNDIGMYFIFVKSLITTCLCGILSKFVLIETRGLTLEEIQDLLRK